jgi:negative regulator of genetic competence, sporulation and motility
MKKYCNYKLKKLLSINYLQKKKKKKRKEKEKEKKRKEKEKEKKKKKKKKRKRKKVTDLGYFIHSFNKKDNIIRIINSQDYYSIILLFYYFVMSI